MKLFLATNSDTAKTDNIKMLEKSCISAIQNTDFEVYVIFDGKKEELNLPKEVNIIEHRHRCYDIFKNSKRNTHEEILKIASSAFLRTEIPYLCNKLGFDDQFIMYTDYDVLFQKRDYSDLKLFKPLYFSGCPEFNKNDWNVVNTGSMLMNIKYFLSIDKDIIEYINKNFENLTTWDQSLYNNLYKNKIDKLPLEYNWKPYWGINPNAKIIHFHGAKPLAVETESKKNEPIVKYLRELNKKGYDYYNSLWEKTIN